MVGIFVFKFQFSGQITATNAIFYVSKSESRIRYIRNGFREQWVCKFVSITRVKNCTGFDWTQITNIQLPCPCLYTCHLNHNLTPNTIEAKNNKYMENAFDSRKLLQNIDILPNDIYHRSGCLNHLRTLKYLHCSAW